MSIDINKIQRTLLEVIDERASQGPGMFQTRPILEQVRTDLSIRSREDEQALLVFWHDLFRIGYLAWGYDIANPVAPFCHVTKQGRKALEHFSRDPLNADGYLAYIDNCGTINPVARSYIEEAAAAYRANCYKATAILVGGASESIILEIREHLVLKMTQSGSSKPPADLSAPQIKRVIDAIQRDIQANKTNMPHSLYESIDGSWGTMVSQIRQTRNDLGHPNNPEIATQEHVHGILLIFPEVVRSAHKLIDWIDNQR